MNFYWYLPISIPILRSIDLFVKMFFLPLFVLIFAQRFGVKGVAADDDDGLMWMIVFIVVVVLIVLLVIVVIVIVCRRRAREGKCEYLPEFSTFFFRLNFFFSNEKVTKMFNTFFLLPHCFCAINRISFDSQFISCENNQVFNHYFFYENNDTVYTK